MSHIRAAYRFTLFFLATIGIYALFLIRKPFVKDKVGLRQATFGTWIRSFVRISKMRVVISGPPPTPPFFMVANHLSYTDIAALRYAAKGIFVAKAEISQWFIIGYFVRDIGTIFINRENRRDIPRAGEEIIERLDAGEGVVVFPEGTSTRGDNVLPFNSSFFEFAARKNLPVSYATLSYSTPAGEMPASTAVSWWDDTGFFAHIWRLFRVREYTATVTFGDEPVLNPDRKVLSARLHDLISERFEPVV